MITQQTVYANMFTSEAINSKAGFQILLQLFMPTKVSVNR